MTDYERGVNQASIIYQEVINDYVAENTKLRELLQRTWDIFHDATAREFNYTKSELRELGIEVD